GTSAVCLSRVTNVRPPLYPANSRRSEAKTILFVSSVADFYGAERSLLEIVTELSPSWMARFVIPERGDYGAALEHAKYPFDVAHVPSSAIRNPLSILRLARIIHKNRARIVHANLQWAAPLVAASSELLAIPFVVHLRNVVTTEIHARGARPFQHASA